MGGLPHGPRFPPCNALSVAQTLGIIPGSLEQLASPQSATLARREEASVLVHGAEGTDTTLLVTALAQVILDPSCRTLVGFQGLLEREWIEVRLVVPRGLGTPRSP